MKMFLLSMAMAASSVPMLLAAEDVATIHARYMKASISHDLETLRSLTAEDATWQLGPRLLEGREEVLSPNKWDAGTSTELEYRDVRIDGNVVEFTLLESNDLLRALGVEVVRHFPRFIFEDGKVKRKEPWQPSPDMVRVNQNMQPLRQWIRDERPEALEVLVDQAGAFVFSREGGELMTQLALEWSRTTKPSGD